MSEASGLQFERADYEQPPAGTVCAQCSRAITTSYYLAGDQTLCGLCRNSFEATRNSGSGIGRFARAAVAGFIAAFLGFLLYYGIGVLTGYEFSLIAIVVGFAVGSAVKWGSNARGGWLYQTLAMLLTYLAIVSSYIPPMVAAFNEMQPSDAAVEAVEEDIAGEGGQPANPEAVTTAVKQGMGTPVGFVIAMILMLALACAAPFLSGFENIIGIVIIAIGLYEAWTLNKRNAVTITGPHTLARPPQAAGA